MLSLLVSLLALRGASAQSAFNFTTTEPGQCQDLTLKWDGGEAPFRLVGIPNGAYAEGMHMFNMSIPDPQGSPPYEHTFKLAEPQGIEMVFALYDASGFKGANVRPLQKVKSSNDKSCLGKLNVDFGLDFSFYIGQGDQNKDYKPSQCDDITLKWRMDNETQRPTFPVGAFGMVPGGTAWEIPIPAGTDGDKGVNWKVNVPGGTRMLLFMTDAGKFGLGGSTAVYEVGSSLQQDCLSAGSHSTTEIMDSSTSSPTPTGSGSPSPSSGGGGGGTSVGAIVGAVVGSVGALALGFIAAFIYFRRKRQHQRTGGAVDLHDSDDPDPMSEEGRQSAQMESLLAGTAGSGHRTRHSRISSGFDSFEGTNNRQSMLTESTDYPYPLVEPFTGASSGNNRDSMVTSNSSNRFMTEKQMLAHNEARRNAGRAGSRSPGPGSSYAMSEMPYVDAGPAPEGQVQGLPPPSYDAVLRARNPDPEEEGTSGSNRAPSPSAASRTEPTPPNSPPQRYSSVVGPRPSLGENNSADVADAVGPSGPSQPGQLGSLAFEKP